jgi:hypothetical protein
MNLKKDLPKILLALFLLWLIFFHRIGYTGHTLASHLYRIVTAPEVKELAYGIFDDVRDVFGGVTNRVRGAVRGGYYPY